MPAVAANKESAVLGGIAIQGEIDIGDQQQIADVIEREDAENDIVHRTHAYQSTDIEHCLAYREFMECVVYGCTEQGLSVGWK